MLIAVENLSKNYPVRDKSAKSGWFSRAPLIQREAVKNISFGIRPGERVAFIGPNGAGKSTTLKMLSGILEPTSGAATVAGLVPWRQRRELAYKIGLVFGQRSQLWYHLPVRESYDLLGKIYGLESARYNAQLKKLTEMFHLAPLLGQPVKSLSLGQRMRCEIAASLIHQPEILFLDEPTIGLDVTTKAELRDHLKALSTDGGVTLILTSHDTADIESVCERVILIHHGEKLIDRPLADMRRLYLRQKQVVLTTGEEAPALPARDGVKAEVKPHQLFLSLDPEKVPVASIISEALATLDVQDVAVNDVPLEEVIKHIYAAGAAP
jgi:ABC-2 type transport system ATP-binding protein